MRTLQAVDAVIEVGEGPAELRLRVPEGTDPAALRARVARYLRGEPDGFGDVPTPEGTPFAMRCWNACRTIPRGEVRTYAWLAAQAGRPGAARAAGQAMRRNPLPIVVPCHRVVGSSGWLGGYSGRTGESDPMLRFKRNLLEMERRAADVALAIRR